MDFRCATNVLLHEKQWRNDKGQSGCCTSLDETSAEILPAHTAYAKAVPRVIAAMNKFTEKAH